MKTLSVLGLGYIGLPTALIATRAGFKVVGYDIDALRVARINNADPVIEEPEIVTHLIDALATKRFAATTTMQSADYYIIAVPTPVTADKRVDLSYVKSAIDALIPVLTAGATIIIESTIPVGTTAAMAQRVTAATGLIVGKDFFIAHCPERVLPGNIFYELVHNDRMVGGVDNLSSDKAAEFYRRFVKGEIHTTNAKTAEMVKLVENSSRDVEIAFAHQVASMAEAADLDVHEVIGYANKHPRVNILQPTCGVGGHCIAIDPWFLVESFPEQSELLRTARKINDHRPKQILTQFDALLNTWQQKFTTKPRVLVAGLTYKPNIDDLRESPALEIARDLIGRDDIEVLICEPHIPVVDMRAALGVPVNGSLAITTFAKGIVQADIQVVLVNHSQFASHADELLLQKIVLDACGMLRAKLAKSVEALSADRITAPLR